MTDLEEQFLRESNAIEGVYDEGSYEQAVNAWIYLIGKKEPTIPVILKTHKILMLNQPIQPDQKGYFRKCEVRIGRQYGLNYVLIPGVMDNWVMNVNDIIKNGQNESKVFLERIIQEQHVKYEKIHPFVDGNGRTGRMFMNWQRLKVGLPILVIKEAEKGKYYEWFR